MFSFFKTQTTQKIVALLLLAILLVAIPLTVWYGQQQQQQQQKAATKVWNGGVDTCGRVKVAFENESPSCSSGTAVTDTYTTTVRMTSNDGKSHQVSYLFESFWCKDSSELGDGVNPTSCIKRIENHSKTGTIAVSTGAGVTVTSIEQKASSYGFGASCGIYQTDFSYTVDGTSCRFGYSALDPSPNHPVLAAGYCNTNQACTIPSTTPTNTPTSTPTETVTPTDTPTSTPTVPTDTVTPTDTPTVGPSATATPTNNPSVTATPTTPVIATSTPKPTLPPTGPGNLVISIGLIGAVAAVIGTVVILAL